MIINDNKNEKEALAELEEKAKEFREEVGDGCWNYRIVKLEEQGEIKGSKYHEVWYEMRDIYYDSEGKIFAWGERPEFFSFESIGDIKFLKERFALALARPIIEIKEDEEGNATAIETEKSFYELEGIDVNEKLF